MNKEFYENGPEGMPRVERMTRNTIMTVLSQKNVPTIYVSREEDYNSLCKFAHAIAEEVLARVPSCPAERSTADVSALTDEPAQIQQEVHAWRYRVKLGSGDWSGWRVTDNEYLAENIRRNPLYEVMDLVYPAPPTPAVSQSQAAGDTVDADPLQGSVNWLNEAIVDLNIADIQQRLCIGYNRAKKLLEVAMHQEREQ